MAEMTHEDIERMWNSVTHFIPDKQKADAAADFVQPTKERLVSRQ